MSGEGGEGEVRQSWSRWRERHYISSMQGLDVERTRRGASVGGWRPRPGDGGTLLSPDPCPMHPTTVQMGRRRWTGDCK
jgi:hypothetical protein